MSMTGNKEQLIVYLLEQPKDKLFDLEQHREKRSTNANAYYWELIEKITAERRKDDPKATKEETHKEIIQTHGAWEKNEDGSVKWVIFPENKPLPNDGYYFDTKSIVTVKGQNSGEEIGRVYIVVKGSHEYNSKEMYDLIQGAIMEAKQLDIETRTPAEIDEMIRLMEQNNVSN